MTGEADEIGLRTGVLLIGLEAAMTEHMADPEVPHWRHVQNGLYRSDLFDVIHAIDTAPFQFDEHVSYKEMMQALETFNDLEYLGRLKPRSRIGLTETGENVARELYATLDEDQREAVITAFRDADVDFGADPDTTLST